MDEKQNVSTVEDQDTMQSGSASDPAVPQSNPIAEKKLRRKIDAFIVPTVALLYLFCFIDRSNIGNARLANFEVDLGLKGHDYNVILSIFYVSYALFELPSMVLCKWIGPGWYLPLTTVGFGIVTIGTAFCETKGQMIACRFLLGIFESGILPGIAYYLSRWYRHSELTFRLGMYMVMTPTAGAFGGLFASGILSLDSFGSLKHWRMIFGIEGIITTLLGVVALGTLTDRPQTARWLNKEENELSIARVQSERVGQEEVVDKMTSAKFKSGVFNPITINTAIIFFFSNIVVLGISFFLPTVIATIYPGKPRVTLQLLTVPPYVVAAFFLLFVSWLSTRLNTRQLFIAASAPIVMVGYAILLATTNANVRYAALFLGASSAFFAGALCNSQVSANSVSDTARTAAIGTNTMFGYLGGLIATWTYLPWDGPLYPIGNGLNLAVSGAIGILGVGGWFWMKMDNEKRDQVTAAEREEQISGLTRQQVMDLDWKHPDFRWRP